MIVVKIEGVRAILTVEAAEKLNHPELAGKEVRCHLVSTQNGVRACEVFYFGEDAVSGYSGLKLGELLLYAKIYLE